MALRQGENYEAPQVSTDILEILRQADKTTFCPYGVIKRLLTDLENGQINEFLAEIISNDSTDATIKYLSSIADKAPKDVSGVERSTAFKIQFLKEDLKRLQKFKRFGLVLGEDHDHIRLGVKTSKGDLVYLDIPKDRLREALTPFYSARNMPWDEIVKLTTKIPMIYKETESISHLQRESMYSKEASSLVDLIDSLYAIHRKKENEEINNKISEQKDSLLEAAGL